MLFAYRISQMVCTVLINTVYIRISDDNIWWSPFITTHHNSVTCLKNIPRSVSGVFTSFEILTVNRHLILLVRTYTREFHQVFPVRLLSISGTTLSLDCSGPWDSRKFPNFRFQKWKWKIIFVSRWNIHFVPGIFFEIRPPSPRKSHFSGFAKRIFY